MFTINGNPISVADLVNAPIETREAILPDFRRYLDSREIWMTGRDQADNARLILALPREDGTPNTDTYWQTSPHVYVRDFVAAVLAGEFTLTEATPTERADQPKDRADQHAALMAMRRREADAIRRMIDAEQRVRDLENNQVTVHAATDDQPLTDWNDPRLRPLLTSVYQVASDQNHCGEFEQIMGAVGGPDRFELGATNTFNASVSAYVEVTYTTSHTERVYVTSEVEFEGRSSHTGREDYERAVENGEIDPSEDLAQRVWDDPAAYLSNVGDADDYTIDSVEVEGEPYASGIHRA